MVPPAYCPLRSSIRELQSALEQRVLYLGPVNRHKVAKAVQLATEAVGARSDVVRYNLTVALIVADLQMDCDTLCAAILNKLIGLPGSTSNDVQRHVGSDVLKIATFDNQLRRTIELCMQPHFTEMSFANLRQLILVAGMDEHRAISLQLARALLSIRTLDRVRDESVKHGIARQTMHLYAPLANQLGIWFVQSELEELAFMHLQPESYHMVRQLVGARRRECESTLAQSKQFLERVLTKSAKVRSAARSVTVKGRVKGLYSVYRKMKGSGKKVCEIYDLLALRVIVQPKRADEGAERSACYAVAEVIEAHYDTLERRAKDYIERPKRNGYRSLHLTVLTAERATPLEIQIRTDKMHHVAEFGAAAHWIYKEKRGTESVGGAAWARHGGGGGGGKTIMVRMKAASASESEGELDMESASKQLSALACSRAGRRSAGAGDEDVLRRGYVTCMASAIRASRVIVAAAGQLYGLAVGSTLMDLARGLGVAGLGAIAVVNGSVAPLTQRLEMNDIVRFICALPEA